MLEAMPQKVAPTAPDTIALRDIAKASFGAPAHLEAVIGTVLPAAFATNLGHFAFGSFAGTTPLNATANTSGYPGDKPTGTRWFDKRAIGSVNQDKLFSDADTAGGQSGACVYITRDA